MIQLALGARPAKFTRMGVLCPIDSDGQVMVLNVQNRPKAVSVDHEKVSILPGHAQQVIGISRQKLSSKLSTFSSNKQTNL